MTDIAYFGFGSNKDLEMMQHMIGRMDIRGIPSRLIGYDLCIQLGRQFRTTIPPNSPAPISPRDLICRSWSEDFQMYVSRPNPTGVIHGMIWFVTPAELRLIRNWELVDFGAQDDAYGIAIGDDGELYEIITQSFIRPDPYEIERVITDKEYEPYIHDKQTMLEKADALREEFLNESK